MYMSIQIPKVSQPTFKTKGLTSIDGTFFGTPVYSIIIYTGCPKKTQKHWKKYCLNLNALALS